MRKSKTQLELVNHTLLYDRLLHQKARQQGHFCCCLAVYFAKQKSKQATSTTCNLASGGFHNGALGLSRGVDVLRAPVLFLLIGIVLRIQDLNAQRNTDKKTRLGKTGRHNQLRNRAHFIVYDGQGGRDMRLSLSGHFHVTSTTFPTSHGSCLLSLIFSLFSLILSR